ncbi:MAG TPA: aromatic acid exporter family protein [Pseudonocardia sp.]|nr:aromatic acid exporter family protein [Pseudonocardia sp.]
MNVLPHEIDRRPASARRPLIARIDDGLRARSARLFRRGRTPGLRTVKTTLAAVLSYVAAEWLQTSEAPILAPLTALLVVQLSMYETVTHGRERIVSVVAGVLVAVGFAHVVGLSWWSLGAVVAVCLIAGRLLRLGPHLPEVAISAMLVLAVGGLESAAWGRVLETLIGAAVGVLVNLLIAPPLYIQPTRDAIGELADRMAGYARGLAEALRAGDWSRAAADQALNQARDLGGEVDRADRGLARTEQSARLNPRGYLAREAQPQLRIALTALEHAQIGMRNLARALLDRTYYLAEDDAAHSYDPDAKQALAAVLDALADAVHAVAPGTFGTDPEARQHVETTLATLGERRDRLAELLLIDPRVDAAAWQQHGALLAATDRLRVEVAAAARIPERPWRPAPITRAGRSRRAADPNR